MAEEVKGEIPLQKPVETAPAVEHDESQDKYYDAEEGEHVSPVITEDIPRAPLSPDAFLRLADIDDAFVERVEEAPFAEFLKKKSHFEDVTRFVFTKTYTKPISTHLASEYHQVSEYCFGTILAYCGERSSKKNPLKCASVLLQIGDANSSEVRDEIYLQIIQQTRENPNRERVLRVWSLWGVLASSFFPSEQFFYHLMNSLLFTMKDNREDSEIRSYATYIFARFYNFYIRDNRKEVPSETEIKYVEQRKQIMIPVLTAEEVVIPLHIESYTTMKEAKKYMLEKLKLPVEKEVVYNFCEVCEKDNQTETRYLENDEKLSDLISLWRIEAKEMREVNATFKLYFRLRVYYPYREYDPAAVFFYYIQMKADVLQERTPVTDAQAAELAAIMLESDYPVLEKTESSLIGKVKPLFPPSMWGNKRENEWISLILQYLEVLKGKKGKEAKIELHRYLTEKNPFALAEFYNAKLSQRNEESDIWGVWPNEVMLGFKPLELLVCDAKLSDIVIALPYKRIMSWGVSQEYFVIVIGDMNYQDKYYFETTQGKYMVFLIQAYCNLAMCKPIPEQVTIMTRSTREHEKQGGKVVKAANRNSTVFQKRSIVPPSNK